MREVSEHLNPQQLESQISSTGDLAEDIIKDVSMVNLSWAIYGHVDLWFLLFNKLAANSLGIWPYSVPSIRPLILRFCLIECPSRSRHLPSSGMFHLRFQTLSVLRYADCSSPFTFSACDSAWHSQRPQSSHLSCHKCQSSYITWSVEMLLRLTWHFHSGRMRRLPQVRLRPHLAQSDPAEEGPSSTGSLCCLFPFFEAGIFISFHTF